MRKLTTTEFIEKARKVHGNKYDYSKVEYINGQTKITIICPTHGKFLQRPAMHLFGRRCPGCFGTPKHTKESFIEKARKVHGNKYDYSKVEYQSNKKHITIICSEHGEFQQRPDNHMQGDTCPKCKMTKGEEKIIKFFKENEIEYEYQKYFDRCKDVKKLPLDFYLPKYNMVIEYNGRQHYIPIKPWGGESALQKIQEHDRIKKEYCENNGIDYFIISHWDYKKIEEILEEVL